MAGENESQGRLYHSPQLPETRLWLAEAPQGCGSASSPRQLAQQDKGRQPEVAPREVQTGY